MHILITDDEPVVLESLARGLRLHGHFIAEALNGDAALTVLKSGGEKIDLVITDYAMGGMDGLELVQNIRRDFGALPIIMMTAYGDKKLVIEALKHHCDGFIEKPFTLDNLLAEIRRIEHQIRQTVEQLSQPELFSKFVHQIRNPLTCITGSAELALLRLEKTQDIKELLRGIIAAAERIESINHLIMNMGKGQKEIREKIDLGSLLENCLKEFEGLMFLKGITLVKEMDTESINIWGHRFNMEQAFKNVILNSLQAVEQSPKKELLVRVNKDESQSEALINITDSGCGIPVNHMEKIFKPYFTTKVHGSGLGLTIVKWSVEKNLGTLSVSSQEGRGSTFQFRFKTI